MANSREASEQIRTLIQQAAQMRALGHSWRQVAEAVNRSESTVRQWPIVHRDLWEAEWFAAHQAVVDEAGAEAVMVLRKQMRAELAPEDAGYEHLGASTRAGIAWRAANTIAQTLARMSGGRKSSDGRSASGANQPSSFDDWSIDELVEEADRRGLPVPDVLRKRMAGENPEVN